MNIADLMRCEGESFPVSELRRLLGIGKTDSYWVLKHRELKTVTAKGKLRILKSGFWEWYDNQTKYHIPNGPPPGQSLNAMSYSVSDLTELLAVSEYVIYSLISRNIFKTFIADYCTRVTKESFDLWYTGQTKFRIPEDRARDEEKLAATYSLPDIGRLLGVHRNTVYSIIGNEKNWEVFDFLTVADQKRITIESFERWYNTQTRYRIHSDPTEESEPLQAETPPEPVREKPDRRVTNKAFHSIDDLQLVLDISYKVAYKLVQSGKVLAVKVGRAYLIPVAEFDRITERRPDNGHDHSEE